MGFAQRDPLVLPAVAVAVGILLGKWLAFSTLEAGWPILAFVALGSLARGKTTAKICFGGALVFLGIFAEAWHRPGAPPEIDARSRET